MVSQSKKIYSWLVRCCFFADGFSTVMRSPCVVFTGHPSLRFGDAVHFMELWGGNSTNAVIFTGIVLFHVSKITRFSIFDVFYCCKSVAVKFCIQYPNSHSSYSLHSFWPYHCYVPGEIRWKENANISLNCSVTILIY